MKNKILTFIIGVLVGAIIATAGFLIYNKTVANNPNQPEMMQMNGNGQMGGQQPGNMEEPPAKPSGNMPGQMGGNASSIEYSGVTVPLSYFGIGETQS